MEMLPTILSLTEMLVSVTLPQLVTAPLMVCGWPTTAVVQVLVTVMHGLSVVIQVFVELAETGVPHWLRAEAVMMLVLPPQTAVSVALKLKPAPGAKVVKFVTLPSRLSLTTMLLRISLPQLVTVPLMI